MSRLRSRWDGIDGCWPVSSARAVSTVFDVALFLLLVSAAVGVLYAAPEPEPADGRGADADDAAALATTLSASTTTVEYAPAFESADAAVRTDRGSIAELLAAATVADATVSGRPLGPDEQYVDAVGNETRTTLAGVGGAGEVQLQTRWDPLPGADIGGATTIGPAPPLDADVHAATVSVPLGTARDSGVAAKRWDESATVSTNRTLVEVARTDGCVALSTAIARRVVGHFFPPESVEATLRGDAAGRRQTATRYETFAAAVGADPDGVPLEDGPRDANAVLVEALADELEPVACDGYADPVTAAREAAPEAVTLVIRTWSA